MTFRIGKIVWTIILNISDKQESINIMIQGVKIKELRVIPDERGRLMEILRHDDPEFKKFGQVYMTTNYPGVVKAWHFHKIQRESYC